ncbi:hypothetical protein SU69_01510 [Thermosipho melanesiensis]|uniref:Uncharacterized protein n=2 Tax=Thermosipho melanesiensis TaxID=46541 RepID=A6LJQ8_THEM4|nr:hypothetical protein [Thermosipho melanesiensis]ABR30159.1 hypothetical protein Tmel_0287 [Thermosipho melanesiensis BI429]APT73358.1 hypothetical protein BW47_01565 [Thermosipho melanesiensis]OOC38173.1 hypothetical protein SU68_01515 [Thermosipho melanesiensis]OOC40094.1 hypothetical protein SU70_01510 [Thermosipho melanesiensis]OOC40147.1 hypothetical protein SU69_01510 [Thermosipho melanesiensis]
MEKQLVKLFSYQLPSDDFVIFTSILFSIGFVSNLFFSFVLNKILISNTIFIIGVLGYVIILWKWCFRFPEISKNNRLIFYFYIIFSIAFSFLAYFFPLLFFISGSLMISLILIVGKKLEKSNIYLKVLFVVLTLSFYLLELAPEINFRLGSKRENH